MRGGRYGRTNHPPVEHVVLRHPSTLKNKGSRYINMPQGAQEKKMNENKGTFGWAIAQLKEGKKVSRTGWNGKNMWIGFMESTTIPADLVNGRTKKFFPDGDLLVQGYFAMFTAQGTWAPGWLASQADMLADDWGVID